MPVEVVLGSFSTVASMGNKRWFCFVLQERTLGPCASAFPAQHPLQDGTAYEECVQLAVGGLGQGYKDVIHQDADNSDI